MTSICHIATSDIKIARAYVFITKAYLCLSISQFRPQSNGSLLLMILFPLFLHAQVHLPATQGQKITIMILQSSQLENVLNSFQSCNGENRAAGNKKHTASKPNLPLLCLYNVCLIFERHSINKNTQGKHYVANCHVFKL